MLSCDERFAVVFAGDVPHRSREILFNVFRRKLCCIASETLMAAAERKRFPLRIALKAAVRSGRKVRTEDNFYNVYNAQDQRSIIAIKWGYS